MKEKKNHQKWVLLRDTCDYPTTLNAHFTMVSEPKLSDDMKGEQFFAFWVQKIHQQISLSLMFLMFQFCIMRKVLIPFHYLLYTSGYVVSTTFSKFFLLNFVE